MNISPLLFSCLLAAAPLVSANALRAELPEPSTSAQSVDSEAVGPMVTLNFTFLVGDDGKKLAEFALSGSGEYFNGRFNKGGDDIEVACLYLKQVGQRYVFMLDLGVVPRETSSSDPTIQYEGQLVCEPGKPFVLMKVPEITVMLAVNPAVVDDAAGTVSSTKADAE